jgi:hypothetical protein
MGTYYFFAIHILAAVPTGTFPINSGTETGTTEAVSSSMFEDINSVVNVMENSTECQTHGGGCGYGYLHSYKFFIHTIQLYLLRVGKLYGHEHLGINFSLRIGEIR